jgi:hypothetical protein
MLYVVCSDHSDCGRTILAVCTTFERAKTEVTASMAASYETVENELEFGDTISYEGSLGNFWSITFVPALDVNLDGPSDLLRE